MLEDKLAGDPGFDRVTVDVAKGDLGYIDWMVHRRQIERAVDVSVSGVQREAEAPADQPVHVRRR